MRPAASALVVTAIGLITGTQAAGAVEGRLSGPFHMRIKVVAGTIQAPGTQVDRTWRFDPLCASGPCGKVRLHRHFPGGQQASTLRRRGPGRYEAVERLRVNCVDGEGHGTQIGRHLIRIVEVDGNKALTVRGRSTLHISGCQGAPHSRAKLEGHLRRRAQQ